MAEYNPFDVERPKRRNTVNPVGMADPNDTGIPYTPPEDGGFTGGASPGTGVPATPAAPASTAQPAYAQYAPAGWEQSKWGNADHTTPKYTVGRILSMYGSTPEGLQQALPAIQAALPGTQLVGTDKLNIPGVGIVDVGVGFDQGGGRGWAWQTGEGGAGTGTSSGLGGGAFGDDVRARISQLMNQSQNPMDSPVYMQAQRAYDTTAQRGAERQRNAIAERMAASGQASSGAMDAQLLGAEQAAGEAKANFAGNLGIRALEQQRQEIMQALQMGAGLMTSEQQLALQEKLGLIDANLQQQGITNQNNQYNSSMGWEQAQYADLMNRIPWQTLLGAQ